MFMFIGIIGFLLFLVFLVKGIVSLVRRRGSKRDFKIALASFVLFAAMAITDGIQNPPEEQQKEGHVADEGAKKEEAEKKQKEESKEAPIEESKKAPKEEPKKEEPKQEEKKVERKPAPASANHGAPAKVVRVVDGDTIEVLMDGEQKQIRMLLIDTPETKHPQKPVEPFGPEASQFATETLKNKTVGIQVGTEETDKYGRVLAYVWVGDTTYQEMVLEKGLATTAYLYNDLTMLDEFHVAQDKAKSKGIGVWSIPGYAHVDHDHGYHYEEEKEVAQKPAAKTTQPKPAEPALKYDVNGPDRDCGDFDSQAEAQAFMEASGPSDPHRLDGSDNDGIACESL